MVNQRVVDYIKKSRELGHGDSDIKAALLNAGHKEEDVRAAFDVADGKSSSQGENVVPLPPIYPNVDVKNTSMVLKSNFGKVSLVGGIISIFLGLGIFGLIVVVITIISGIQSIRLETGTQKKIGIIGLILVVVVSLLVLMGVPSVLNYVFDRLWVSDIKQEVVNTGQQQIPNPDYISDEEIDALVDKPIFVDIIQEIFHSDPKLRNTYKEEILKSKGIQLTDQELYDVVTKASTSSEFRQSFADQIKTGPEKRRWLSDFLNRQ